jgi:HNH endonuclease
MTARKPGANYFRGSVAERLKFYSMPIPSGCVLWTGAKRQSGHGYTWNGAKVTYAHIVSYELAKGPVPKGFELHHTCVNSSCVNPDHLQPVTRGDHQRLQPRRFVGDVTHCKRDHKFTPENTYFKKNGRRSCRACHRMWQAAYRRKMKQMLA